MSKMKKIKTSSLPEVDEQLFKQWFSAIANGQEKQMCVELLAEEPALLTTNAVDPQKQFAGLHYAAFHGLEDAVVQILAKKPALIDSVDEEGATPLHVAAGRGHDKVLEHLLLLVAGTEGGGSSVVEATNFDGLTALHFAATAGSSRAVELLLAACPALLDVVDADGCTALLLALGRKHGNVAEQLLAANPKNLEAMDLAGSNVLHVTINQKRWPLVWRLLELMPELASVPLNGVTPLCLAMLRGCDERTIEKLFQLYPQANRIGSRTALHIAVNHANDFCINLLLPSSTFDQIVAAFGEKCKSFEERVKPILEAQFELLSTLLHHDVLEIVNEYLFGEVVLQKKQQPPANKERAREVTQLLEAVRDGNEEMVSQLLNEDPTLIEELIDDDGETALHIASYGGHESIVTLLIAAKPALVGVSSGRTGQTALHKAVSAGEEHILELLLAVSPSSALIVDFDGRTALMDAARLDMPLAVELLLAACPSALDLVDFDHSTALLDAFRQNNYGIVDLLLAANPKNVMATDSMGWNVLHHACYRGGKMEVVEKLLTIDHTLAETKTKSNSTPLALAMGNAPNELIEKLFRRFPQAASMFDDVSSTPFFMAVRFENDFVIELFQAKMTFDYFARGFRNFRVFHEKYGEKRLRAVMDAHCEEFLMVVKQASLLEKVYGYLGFGTLVTRYP